MAVSLQTRRQDCRVNEKSRCPNETALLTPESSAHDRTIPARASEKRISSSFAMIESPLETFSRLPARASHPEKDSGAAFPHHDAWPPHKLVKSSISPDTNVHPPSDARKQTRAALYECRKNEEGAKKNRAERKEDRGDDRKAVPNTQNLPPNKNPVISKVQRTTSVVLRNERREGVPRITSQGNPPRPSPPFATLSECCRHCLNHPHEEAVLRIRGSHPTRASASTQRARWQGISDNKHTTGRARRTQSHAGWLLNHCFEKRLHTTCVRHSCDTRRAVLRVACGVSLRSACVVLCVVVPQVCWLVTHTNFSGWSSCAVTGGCVHAQATPNPKGVTAVPHPLQPSGLRTRGIPSHCSPPVCHLVARPHCRVCVRHSRAGRMTSLNAVSPHSHIVTSPRRHTSPSRPTSQTASPWGRAVGLWVIAEGV